LSDGDLSTAAENGAPGSDWWFCANEPCQYFCVLNESMEIDHIIAYPRQDNWQWFRSTDVKIEVYESVEFAVDVSATNASYDLMDAATFGTLIYEVDHIALNTEPNIVIPLMPNDVDAPIQVLCPYKYAFSCEDVIDEQFCQNAEGYGSWKALFAEYDSVDNSDLEWFCFNDSHLTDDLLNYKMKYTQSEAEYDIFFNVDDSSVESVLDECTASYIVDSVDYDCSVNGVTKTEIDDLSADDVVFCELSMSNADGDGITFDNLQWATSILAKEVDFKYFPVKSVTVIDEENGTVSTNFTMPNCGGIWDVSLAVDQTPIGGDEFVLWSLENVDLNANASRAESGCNDFYGQIMAALIDDDGFESKFTAFTSFTEDMLNLSFVSTTSPPVVLVTDAWAETTETDADGTVSWSPTSMVLVLVSVVMYITAD